MTMGILELISAAMPKVRLAAMLAGADRDKSAGRRGARGYWDRPSRYDGAALRAIRAEKGVGRPPHIGEQKLYIGWRAMWSHLWDYQTQCDPKRNMAEWLRKPRSKRHVAQGAKQ